MTDELSIKLIGEEWSRKLRTMMFSPEFEALGKFIASQRMKYTIYPKQEDVFKAFRLTPFNSVKIVILGQDPYHDEGSATGLAFANPSKRVVPSPSLRQILREVENDCYEGFDFEHFTDLNLLDAPTPITVVEIIWVVLTGAWNKVARNITAVAPV